jgi:DNA-binding NarL/FixJ family response regulator
MLKCRILLVDDYLPIREEVHRLLAHEPDFEIVGEAGDGKEAISLVSACRPDIVLLDLNMPIMNGIEAAKLIKESWPKTTIIGLCEVKDTYTLDVFMKAGADAVLSKASIALVRSTTYLMSQNVAQSYASTG